MFVGSIKIPATFMTAGSSTVYGYNSNSASSSDSGTTGGARANYNVGESGATSYYSGFSSYTYSWFDGFASGSASTPPPFAGNAGSSSTDTGYAWGFHGDGFFTGEIYNFQSYTESGSNNTAYHNASQSQYYFEQDYQETLFDISDYISVTFASYITAIGRYESGDTAFQQGGSISTTSAGSDTNNITSNSGSGTSGSNDGPRMHPELNRMFAVTVSTTSVTATNFALTACDSTDSYTYPVGTTTQFANGVTANTTVSTSYEISVKSNSIVTYTYTSQHTTWVNEVQWGNWDTQTVLIPCVDIFNDDWIWVIYPTPGSGASGDISQLAFSIENEFTVQPPTVTPSVYVYPVVNSGDTTPSAVTNNFVVFDFPTSQYTFTTATGSPVLVTISYNSTTLPMEAVTTNFGFQDTFTISIEETISSVGANTGNLVPAAAVITYNVTHYPLSSKIRTMSWYDSNSCVNTLSSSTSNLQLSSVTYGSGAFIYGYVQTSSSATDGAAAYQYQGITVTLSSSVLGPFSALKADDSIFDVLSYSTLPHLNAFRPSYPYKGNAFHIQTNLHDTDQAFRAIGADIPMPYKLNTLSFENASDSVRMIHDPAGAYVPYMYWYNSSGSISGQSSFLISASNDSNIFTSWFVSWDSSGFPSMSVTSQSSGITAGTSTGIVASESFVNGVFGFDPADTVTQTFTPPGLLRGTVLGGHQRTGTNKVTLLLGGAFSSTEVSSTDINWGSTFYPDWTTVTIDTSVISVLEHTTIYQIYDGNAGDHNFYAARFSKHSQFSFETSNS